MNEISLIKNVAQRSFGVGGQSWIEAYLDISIKRRTVNQESSLLAKSLQKYQNMDRTALEILFLPQLNGINKFENKRYLYDMLPYYLRVLILKLKKYNENNVFGITNPEMSNFAVRRFGFEYLRNVDVILSEEKIFSSRSKGIHVSSLFHLIRISRNDLITNSERLLESIK